VSRGWLHWNNDSVRSKSKMGAEIMLRRVVEISGLRRGNAVGQCGWDSRNSEFNAKHAGSRMPKEIKTNRIER